MWNEQAAQCTAKSKSTGERCKNPCVTGSTKCRLHGGKSLKGAEHPQFKDGRYSKYMPVRLQAIYQEIEQDLEANILSRNIHLREALIRQKLEMLEDAPDSQQAWNELRTLVDDVHTAYNKMDDAKMTLTLEKINRVIDERVLYHMAATEIRKDLNEQRNDTTAKANISMKGESAISAAELMAFVGAIMNLISSTVSNSKERESIYHAIQRLTSTQESASGEFVEIEADNGTSRKP